MEKIYWFNYFSYIDNTIQLNAVFINHQILFYFLGYYNFYYYFFLKKVLNCP